jgi:hypothetical protein
MRKRNFLIVAFFLVVAWVFFTPAGASAAECNTLKEACQQGTCPNMYDEGGTQIAGNCKMVGKGCQCEYTKSAETCKKDMKGNCNGKCPDLYKTLEKKGKVPGKCRTASPCACFYYR